MNDSIAGGCIVLLVCIVLVKWLLTKPEPAGRVVAFFHPYCDHGGGGERVLWIMIEHLLKGDATLRVAIYNGGLPDVSRLLRLVQTQFHIDLTAAPLAGRIILVNISSRTLLDACWYPLATMLMQSAMSLLVGLECLLRLQPDVYIDTTGAAFTYLLFALARCRVVAYVHYPIISSDMLQRVREQRPAHNNAGAIASSVSISHLKLVYYQAIARVYALAGACAAVVMVNSSWTEGHIAALWRLQKSSLPSPLPSPPSLSDRRLFRIYPPCNTAQLQALPLLLLAPREPLVLSIGQFRPEKDHALQLRAWKVFRLEHPDSTARLVLVGSARHADDDKLVAALRHLADELGVADSVELVANAPYARVTELLSRASVGLHTMWNEHFGISVVEMMAAGLVVVAHDSGGPRMDIVVPAARAGLAEIGDGISTAAVGYLASSVEDYARCLGEVLGMSETRRGAMRARARASVSRFSDDAFARGVAAALKTVMGNA